MENKNSNIFKFSLLSISLLSALAQAVSAAFPAMYSSFPTVDQAAIETLGTVPNFGCLFGLVISPIIIKFTNKKVTVMLGLLITLIAGTFPVYADSYTLILISRVLLGFGLGLFNSLAVSLLSDYFEGKELSKMFGFQNAMGSIGSGICSFILGYLLIFGWHAAFSIYLLAIPALVLFGLFVPLISNDKQKTHEASLPKEKNKQHLSLSVVGISSILFLFFILLVPMSYKMPQLIVSESIGSTSDASMVYGVFTLVGIPVSMIYGYLRSLLGFKLYPISLLCIIAGFLTIANTNSLLIIYIAGIILGIGFGLAVPFGYNWISEASDPKSINLATTVALLCINMGVFLSPVVMNFLATTFSSGSPRDVMRFSGIGFVLLLTIILINRVFSSSIRGKFLK